MERLKLDFFGIVVYYEISTVNPYITSKLFREREFIMNLIIRSLLIAGSLSLVVGVASAAEIVPSGTVTASAPMATTPQSIATMETLAATPPAAPAWYKGPIPTMNAAAYDAYKKKATLAAAQSTAPRLITAPAAKYVPPLPRFINLAGSTQAASGNWSPPDTHGAAGNTHVCEVTNSHLDCYTKAQATVQWGTTLAALFAYTGAALFDPRILYDADWDRWIVTAETFADAVTGLQYQYIAVSKTADPTAGTWWVQRVVVTAAADFWDYPNMGMDRDTLFITGNVFIGGVTFGGSKVIRIPKAKIYNGLGWSSPIWSTPAIKGTLTPPITSGAPRVPLFASAPTSTVAQTTIHTYKMFYASTDGPIFVTATPITTTGFVIPPNAQQPPVAGVVSPTIDTLDGRLLGNIYQVGTSLYMMHTVGWAGGTLYATPEWIRATWATGVVAQRGQIVTGGSSDEFNATLAVNSIHQMFVSYTTTNRSATVGYAPQVRITGKVNADTFVSGVGSTLIYQSPAVYNYGTCSPTRGCRWGDYSGTSIDPVNTSWAWTINETSEGTGTTWGSRIARFGY